LPTVRDVDRSFPSRSQRRSVATLTPKRSAISPMLNMMQTLKCLLQLCTGTSLIRFDHLSLELSKPRRTVRVRQCEPLNRPSLSVAERARILSVVQQGGGALA